MRGRNLPEHVEQTRLGGFIMHRFITLFLIWMAVFQLPAVVLAPSRAQAPSSPAEQEQFAKEMAALVHQLGSSSFHEREEAQRKLLKVMATVRTQLQRASKSVDKEVARRASAILDEVRKLDQAPAEERPTDEKFYLRIEPLIDNVADLDVRRLTVFTKGPRRVKFYVEVGAETNSARQPDQGGDTHMFEAILVLRLRREKDSTLNRCLKFSRESGGLIETNLPAPGVKSLRDLVKIKAASGLYILGKAHVLGQILGADVVVTVE